MADTKRSEVQSLIESAAARLPYSPLEQQSRLLAALAYYACAREPAEVFILNGYAGTGKTSLVAAMINALAVAGKHTVMLAPTGRAAKVAAAFSGRKTSTIHRRIFRPLSSSPDAGYFLTPNLQNDTIFIIDEASLVSDSQSEKNSLLSMLLRHIYSAPGCGLILIGDTAQLPPIGQSDSPAMNPDRLRQLGFSPVVFNLDTPVRQAAESGVLYNATRVRRMISLATSLPADSKLPSFYLDVSRFPDVEAISSADLADMLSSSWSSGGQEETLLLTRSNYRANDYNRAVRNLVMMADEPLQRGDRIIISKNDYYWSKVNKLKTFLANGDTAVVEWVGRNEKMYGRYFCDVELFLPADNVRIGCKIMLKSLVAEGPSLSRDDLNRFYTHVLADQEGELSEKIKAAADDPYYNAIQAKYAYCVTCHKAQGGQWRHVYIDMAGIAPEAMNVDFYRWLYTAITRSREKVFFINPTIEVR
ncbi:MAG: AAA family ATPase, partial [Muribaculaceae bacterium]|nr:AAA family ATPase [Muribaculaceae bacterium]